MNLKIIIKLSRLLGENKKSLVAGWSSYFLAMILEYASGSLSVKNLLLELSDFSKLSIILLWGWSFLIVIISLLQFVVGRIKISKNKVALFNSIMQKHTYEVLNRAQIGAYSWGYDKSICSSQNPIGFSPYDVYIDVVNSEIDCEYTFPDNNNELPGYDKQSFEEYLKHSDKIKTIKNRGDDAERYSVFHIEKAMKTNKIEIRLQKTRWSQLQFSWDYLRRLDTHNNVVESGKNDSFIEEKFVQALNHENNLLINSFCLHLILVSKNGKVILSRISNVKSNDYPSTWAATLGEQIEKNDFISNTGNVYSDFVIRWVKRALDEELSISEDVLNEYNESELEEYVDMDSLKVLSVDFEGDIYNIALTCILKLRIDASELKRIKGIQIDSNETTKEFIECSEEEVRKILLDYPNNCSEYHPSTYLRLLLYHLYCDKQKYYTYSQFIKSDKKSIKTNSNYK